MKGREAVAVRIYVEVKFHLYLAKRAEAVSGFEGKKSNPQILRLCGILSLREGCACRSG